MGAVSVTTPSGVTWTVRRRWIPHREGIGIRSRLKRHLDRLGDGDSGWLDIIDLPDFGSDLGGVAIVIGLIVVFIVLALIGLPLVLVGIDLIWLVLVLVFGVFGRVVLRRPWRVEARSGDERRQWFVQGYRAAGAHRDEIARQFRHGQNPVGVELALLPH